MPFFKSLLQEEQFYFINHLPPTTKVRLGAFGVLLCDVLADEVRHPATRSGPPMKVGLRQDDDAVKGKLAGGYLSKELLIKKVRDITHSKEEPNPSGTLLF